LVATQLASEPVCLRNIRIAAEGSVFFFLIAPHTNGPRDLPWCGALEFTSKAATLHLDSADFAATSAAGRATTTFLPEGRTLTLEKLKYALESWWQTTAFVGFSSAKLFDCIA
jgi:hypothetical protein